VVVTALAVAAVACSGAEGDDVLTVVTHDAFLVSDDVIASFEEQTGIDVRFLTSADVGTLVTEAVLTRDNPTADVLFGIDNTFLSRGFDEELFLAYESPGLAMVPAEFQVDAAHRVTPIDYGDVCVNVSQAPVDAAPMSFDDLRQPQHASQWVTQNPETSSPGLAMLLATVAVYGEDGWENFWIDAADNGLEVTSGWTEAYFGAFVAGGGDRTIVTSYASSPVAEVALAETPLDSPTTSILPDTCFRQIEFAGILANAEHPAAARQFIDFMLTDEFQNDVPLNMFVYPVSTTATLPAVFVENTTVVESPLRLDPTRIGEMRDEWTARWVELVLR
jgi:thiamine transport system substrate-binding protein